MHPDLEKDKRNAITTLKEGLTTSCADDITEVLINLEDGTCDYIELIPILEEVARVDWFYYFDDNGAGGQPHRDPRRKTSFKSWAVKAIENINENNRFESCSRRAEVQWPSTWPMYTKKVNWIRIEPVGNSDKFEPRACARWKEK